MFGKSDSIGEGVPHGKTFFPLADQKYYYIYKSTFASNLRLQIFPAGESFPCVDFLRTQRSL